MEHESDDYTNRDWCIRYCNLRTIKGTGGLSSWRASWDHPNYSIDENGQNTEKSSGHLRILAVTQTPVKDHQLTLTWKTLCNNNNNNKNTLYRLILGLKKNAMYLSRSYHKRTSNRGNSLSKCTVINPLNSNMMVTWQWPYFSLSLYLYVRRWPQYKSDK